MKKKEKKTKGSGNERNKKTRGAKNQIIREKTQMVGRKKKTKKWFS